MKQKLINLKSILLDKILRLKNNKRLKQLIATKNKQFYRIYAISVVSFILLIVSPTLSIGWLCLITVYFLFIREYKPIFKIWLHTLVIWYSILCLSLYDVTPIVIGPGHTEELVQRILNKDLFFDSLCFQTIYLLNDLSLFLGCDIYIPIVNLFSFFNRTSCSGKGDKSGGTT